MKIAKFFAAVALVAGQDLSGNGLAAGERGKKNKNRNGVNI